MSSSSFTAFFAQVNDVASNAAAAASGVGGTDATNPPPAPWWLNLAFPVIFVALIYFAFLRPQATAAKQKDEAIKTAKTGDKVITSSGIHGVITNVKETTVIVKVADNVKLEIEKTHIEKITRSSDPAPASTDKPATAKT